MESMSMPVVVGLLLTVMFLISFSQWFYNLFKGWRELVIDDMFLIYRVIGATILSFSIMFAGFWIIATVNECKEIEVEKEGIFKQLNCKEYWEIRTGAESLFSLER